MKAISVIVVMLVVVTASAQTQKDIFNPSTKIVWLGLDFTKARMIDDNFTGDAQGIVLAWNKLIIAEPEKFNISKGLDRPKLEEHVDVAIDHNAAIDLSSFLSGESSIMKRPDVDDIISTYDFKGLGGVGVIFVVDKFSKPAQLSSIWVTFVNMDAKKVIFAEKIEAKPTGFGIRNYWGGAIYKTMKQIGWTEYDRWKDKYKF